MVCTSEDTFKSARAGGTNMCAMEMKSSKPNFAFSRSGCGLPSVVSHSTPCSSTPVGSRKLQKTQHDNGEKAILDFRDGRGK